MLRTASELRHEPFFWVKDLSMPDTLFQVAGFPINILPIIMGVTMFLQMSMMPVSPTADPTQPENLQVPALRVPDASLQFLFRSGALLGEQNILTIVRQKITNAMPDEPLQSAATDATGSRRAASRRRSKLPFF